MVTLLGSPPNDAMFSLTRRAATISCDSDVAGVAHFSPRRDRREYKNTEQIQSMMTSNDDNIFFSRQDWVPRTAANCLRPLENPPP
jgi:hypothetical protein